MYDEPFAGLDPISLGVIVPADPRAQRRARHHVDRRHRTTCTSRSKIVDYVYFVSDGRIDRAGHAGRSARSRRAVRAPVRRRRARRPGAVPLPGARLRAERARRVLMRCMTASRRAPAPPRHCRRSSRVWRLGFASALPRRRSLHHSPAGAAAAPAHVARDLLRRRAVARHHHGVGPVRRHGARRCRATTCCSATARGVARRAGRRCRSCASSGRWCRRCCSRAAPARAITAEIGLMKATEQLAAMEMMAVDPLARVVAPRFWGGVISMPLLAALFSALGIFGALARRRAADRRRRRRVLVADAGRASTCATTSSTASSRASCSVSR